MEPEAVPQGAETFSMEPEPERSFGYGFQLLYKGISWLKFLPRGEHYLRKICPIKEMCRLKMYIIFNDNKLR
jgi:hypothetical protein